MRTLVHVPIIHSEADLGSLAPRLASELVGRLGHDAWATRNATVDTMWADIQTRVLSLPLDWSTVRLFQDGLPVFGRERDLVEDLANKGSRNHQLLMTCIGRGATLTGTEDPALLVREYNRIGRLLTASSEGLSDQDAAALVQEGHDLLAARDKFMAQRIDATTGPHETALLFVGLMHEVDQQLQDSFEIVDLLASLPLNAEPERQIQEGHDHEKQRKQAR
jgi:hypothetical protein